MNIEMIEFTPRLDHSFVNIEMVEFTPDYIIPSEGKYLVKTITNHLKSTQYLQARCTIVFNEKKKTNITSVDVTNQTVTHISKEPLQ